MHRNRFLDAGGKFGASSAYSGGNLVVGAPAEGVPTDQSFDELKLVGEAILYEEEKQPRSDSSDQDVVVSDVDLQPNSIDEDPSSHTLTFTVKNISGDGVADHFSIEMPDNVNINNINSIEATPNYEPEWTLNGSTIEFNINPDTVASSFDMDVTVKMTLKYRG